MVIPATPLLKFTVFPAQTGVFEVTDGDGKAFTVTDALDVLLHPLPSVTVTE